MVMRSSRVSAAVCASSRFSVVGIPAMAWSRQESESTTGQGEAKRRRVASGAIRIDPDPGSYAEHLHDYETCRAERVRNSAVRRRRSDLQFHDVSPDAERHRIQLA